jgi:hypothetical protein
MHKTDLIKMTLGRYNCYTDVFKTVRETFIESVVGLCLLSQSENTGERKVPSRMDSELIDTGIF